MLNRRDEHDFTQLDPVIASVVVTTIDNLLRQSLLLCPSKRDLEIDKSIREPQYSSSTVSLKRVQSIGSRSLWFGSSTDVVIHPGVSLDVAKVEEVYRTLEPEIADITLPYRIVADGVGLQHGSATIPADEIGEILNPQLRGTYQGNEDGQARQRPANIGVGAFINCPNDGVAPAAYCQAVMPPER